MKAKKGFIIGGLILAGVAVFAFVYMWSLGVFSGSAFFGERNAVLEEAVTERLNERMTEAFKDHESLTVMDVKSYAALYVKDYPVERYSEETELSDEELDKIIKENDHAITAEISLEGENVQFQQYKETVYDIVTVLNETISFEPAQLQIFYYRHPEDNEEKSVMQYESKVQGYLFGSDKKTIVTASGVHFVVEADEVLTKKFNATKYTKIIYISVVSFTVIALTGLLIVRSTKKRKRYKK